LIKPSLRRPHQLAARAEETIGLTSAGPYLIRFAQKRRGAKTVAGTRMASGLIVS
jgi:hypothetical protein